MVEGRSSGSALRLARDSDRGTREKVDVPTATAPLTGDALLVAVTDAMVGLHQRYHHRAPVTARTQLLGGDLLACVLGGVYTDVEKTMIELRHSRVGPDLEIELFMLAPEADAAGS